jgi:hypothetical protein
MKWFSFVLLLLSAAHLEAHPSSGIVVTDKGEVYFVHSGVGVARIDPDGKLVYVKRSTGGHWLCLDREGAFARTQPKFFERITPDGERPAILFADGGAPIAVGRDAQLYFGSNYEGGDKHPPGGLTVSRQTVTGKLSLLSTNLAAMLRQHDEGVTGLAAAPDASVYVASPSSIWHVNTNGAVRQFPGHVGDCDENLPPNWKAPGFRGLCVATNGTVYAAATGCRCVITLVKGVYETILKSERPWSPTDVAWHDGHVFVLEWTNPNGAVTDGWRPRVRKLAPHGTIRTLVEGKENLPVR